jgi:hypothetical protein
VRAHLAPQLGRDVAPNLILALIDDLTLEVLGASSEGGPIGVRTTLSDDSSPIPPPVSARRPSLAEIGSTPFPRLKQSVANLVRTASTKLHAVRPTAVDTSYAKVALVEADRVVRASVARTLLSAQFDVTAFDTPFEAAQLAASPHPLVVVIDLATEGAESALRVLAKSFPILVVVVWTDVPTPIVDVALDDIGVADYHLLPRSAGTGEVIDTVRRLLASVSAGDSKM